MKQHKGAGHNGVLGATALNLLAVTTLALTSLASLWNEQGLVIEDLVFLMTAKELIMNQEVVLKWIQHQVSNYNSGS